MAETTHVVERPPLQVIPPVFPYSASFSTTAKGAAQIEVKVNFETADELEQTLREATLRVVKVLAEFGIPTAWGGSLPVVEQEKGWQVR